MGRERPFFFFFMPEKTEYVVVDDGYFERRRIITDRVEVTQAIVDQIGQNSRRKLGYVSTVDNMPVNLQLGSNRAYWTIRLAKLTLRAPWRLHEGNLVPVFNSTTDPVMAIDWVPPMPVYFVMSENIGNHTVEQAWLFAGAPGNFYRLPLANIFDDGRICMGRDPVPRANNSLDNIRNWLQRFASAQWNADLWHGTDQTFVMFRFQPQEARFIQQPVTGDWRTLCTALPNTQDSLSYVTII